MLSALVPVPARETALNAIIFSLIVAAVTLYILHRRRAAHEQFTASSAPLKVYLNGFWDGIHERGTVRYFTDILTAVYGRPVTEGSKEESELLLESLLGKSVAADKKWMHTYHYTGEPDIRADGTDKYSIVLSGNPNGSPSNNVATPYYASFLYEIPALPDKPASAPRPMPTKDVVCIISNPRGGVRNALLDELDKHFQVTYAGKYKNNTGGPMPHLYLTPEFVDYISQFKFVISMENSEHDCYITEKIFHGIRAGTVPVYWGAPRVTDYINKDRFIRITDEASIPAAIRKMKELAANGQAWQAMVAQPWRAPGQPQPTPEETAKEIRRRLLL